MPARPRNRWQTSDSDEEQDAEEGGRTRGWGAALLVWQGWLKRASVAFMLLVGFACLLLVQYPKVNSVDVANLGWIQAQCQVLLAGVEYKGTCELGERHRDTFDVREGNYTDCSPFLWCAEEGERCACDGTVRYGSVARSFLTSKVVDVEVMGEVICSTEAFGQDPAALRRKQCWCRPRALQHLTKHELSPASCFGSAGTDWDLPHSAWGAVGQHLCEHRYLPWALVSVQLEGHKEPPKTRCAYQYGADRLSIIDKPKLTERLYHRFAMSESTFTCYVLNIGQEGAAGANATPACVVALETPENGLLKRWEETWTAVVSFRSSVCWGVLAMAFCAMAPALMCRYRMISCQHV